MPNLPEDAIQRLGKKYGKNIGIFLESLARFKQFEAAIETPIGKAVLDDSVRVLKDRVDKVINEEDTPEIRAEIRVLREILERWSSIINKGLKDQQEYNQTIGR